jgi:regulatory protein
MDRDQHEKLLAKMRRYCAYRERCSAEILDKMYSYEASTDEKQEILDQLKSEDYLNDERYAQAVVTGKFRQNRWGRRKIRARLIEKGIKNSIIDRAIDEIDEDNYTNTLRTMLQKQIEFHQYRNNMEHRQRLVRFAQAKGYEYEVVNSVISTLY